MGTHAPIFLQRDSPVLYIVGAQAPKLLQRDSPVLYIVGVHAPILLKEDFPFLYNVGAQALILLERDSPVLYIVSAQAPTLLKRDSLVLYIMGVNASIHGQLYSSASTSPTHPSRHTSFVFKEGLSRSVYSGCTGTHIKKKSHFQYQVQYVTQCSCMGIVSLLEHRPTSARKRKKCMCVSVRVYAGVRVCVCVIALQRTYVDSVHSCSKAALLQKKSFCPHFGRCKCHPSLRRCLYVCLCAYVCVYVCACVCVCVCVVVVVKIVDTHTHTEKRERGLKLLKM